MKKLRKLLLINWHKYKFEVIDFDKDITFLTGKTKSGKSTIIDAIQLLILGDTSGKFFNKAADSRGSDRTLDGYLKCEYGEDGDDGLLYLRDPQKDGKAFTSYIVAEFFDHYKNQPFTIGVAFDTHIDKNDNETQFFLIHKNGIPECYFKEKDSVSGKDRYMNCHSLRLFLTNNYKENKEICNSPNDYRRKLIVAFGSLKNSFFDLFRRSVGYVPLDDIKTFIHKYVCNAEKVDISDIKQTLMNYRDLEEEIRRMKLYISLLENIENNFNIYRDAVNKHKEQSYLIIRSKKQKILNDIDCLELEIKNNFKLIDEYKKKEPELFSQVVDVEKNIIEIEKKITETGFDTLTLEIGVLKEKIDTMNNIILKLLSQFRNYGRIWSIHIETLDNLNMDFDENTKRCFERLYVLVSHLISISEEEILKFNINMLYDISKETQCLLESLEPYYNKLSSDLESLLLEEENLKKEINYLKNNKMIYKVNVLPFRDEIVKYIKSKYSYDIEISLLHELIDVKDKAWQNAIEAYLNTQRFYLIVEPSYYDDAFEIYEKQKFIKSYYDIGLVDIGMLMKRNIISNPNSLATEIVTQNKYAKAFIDYVLGRVIKCEHYKDLRSVENRTAITKTCMLYKNYVSRQLNKELWEIPYIGKASLSVQLNIKLNRYSYVKESIENLTKLRAELANIRKSHWFSIDSINNIEQLLNSISDYLDNNKLLQSKIGELDSFGEDFFSYIEKLKDSKKYLVDKKLELEKEKNDCYTKIKLLEQVNASYENREIPNKKGELTEIEEDIKKDYRDDWIMSYGEHRFNKIYELKKSPELIISDYKGTITSLENKVEEADANLTRSRDEYCSTRNLSYSRIADNNDGYHKDLVYLKNTMLVEYEAKAGIARERAYEQFRNEFIAKLRLNIHTVKSQINELNAALKHIEHNGDKFKFTDKCDPDYEPYYKMIMDPMHLSGGDGILADEFQQRYGNIIEEFFNNIVYHEDGELTKELRLKFENNIEKYTDYRTYFKFELEIEKNLGTRKLSERLSKTYGKKSGGEKQLPFYICVLASFYKEYRIYQDIKNRNTCRLVVFDEVFNNMDEEIIEESISLLREMQFQVILAATSEKVPCISPHVDKTLTVVSKANSAKVYPYIFEKDNE